MLDKNWLEGLLLRFYFLGAIVLFINLFSFCFLDFCNVLRMDFRSPITFIHWSSLLLWSLNIANFVIKNTLIFINIFNGLLNNHILFMSTKGRSRIYTLKIFAIALHYSRVKWLSDWFLTRWLFLHLYI